LFRTLSSALDIVFCMNADINGMSLALNVGNSNVVYLQVCIDLVEKCTEM
jgi:hypothetical protein